jgi:drug/metabolite transporter (DMT)-like permease
MRSGLCLADSSPPSSQTRNNTPSHQKGLIAALSSAFFLGVVPIFGKIALTSGLSPFAIIAIRTGLAALLMLVVMVIWMRKYFFIYPIGLWGCILAGIINGLGSILYYSALNRLDASVGHMLYSFYPLFVAFWLILDRQAISRMTAFRLLLSAPAIFLLIQNSTGPIDLAGALMMLGSALLYALHLLINQRILYEAPAPTVTLYTLLGMAATVIIAYFILDLKIPPLQAAWWAVTSMALITFFSRFTLFLGIKHLGGLQTALIGLSEIYVTLFLSIYWLGERLSLYQWIGAALLSVSLLLVSLERIPQQKSHVHGWLSWLNPPPMNPTDFTWPGHL